MELLPAAFLLLTNAHPNTIRSTNPDYLRPDAGPAVPSRAQDGVICDQRRPLNAEIPGLQFSCFRGRTMPSYLFHCRDCLKPFTKQLSLHEYEKGGIVCRFCGSDDVEQQLSSFYVVTSRKSA